MVRLASLDDIVASKEFASLDKATKRCQSCASKGQIRGRATHESFGRFRRVAVA